MDYPNREVDEAFSTHLLSTLSGGFIDKTTGMLYTLAYAMEEGNIEEFIKHINGMLAGLSYTITIAAETYYHSLFYLVVKLAGYQISTEVLSIHGRIDAVIKTNMDIYILEFRIDQPADKALRQIHEKRYAAPYLSDGRPVTLLGINFNTDKKRIDDYKWEEAERNVKK